MCSKLGLAVVLPLLMFGATEAAAMDLDRAGPRSGYLAELGAASSTTAAVDRAALASNPMRPGTAAGSLRHALPLDGRSEGRHRDALRRKHQSMSPLPTFSVT
jgi:hypothetical protein